jgi:hypothetical protein
MTMNIESNRSAAPRPRAAALVTALALGFAGCTKEQKSVVDLVPASGKVTLDGSPLAEAELEFIPEGGTRGQGGAALTNADGTYTANTPYGEPGLAAGEYKVVISKLVLAEGMTSENPADRSLPPADNPYREVLSPAYSDRMISSLRARVAPDKPSINNFLLKSGRKR